MKPILCTMCDFWIAPVERTPEEEKLEKMARLRSQGVDMEVPLPPRPGTCHLNPPKVEVVPAPNGQPISLTIWPQTPGDSVGCSYGDQGIIKE